MNRHRNELNMSLLGDGSIETANVPASARVFDKLRARIVSLDLPPGTILSRAELAEAFGVSQSPIREAILRLEQVGLVVSYRQSRTEVTKINVARLKQEHFLRTALECEVVNLLAGLGDDDALTSARGHLKLQHALVDDLGQVALLRQLDADFHRALFTAAGYEDLHGFITERSSQMARVRSLDLPRKRKFLSVVEGHGKVIERIEAGDRQGATDAMRAHLSETMARLPEIIAEHEDFFA